MSTRRLLFQWKFRVEKLDVAKEFSKRSEKMFRKWWETKSESNFVFFFNHLLRWVIAIVCLQSKMLKFYFLYKLLFHLRSSLTVCICSFLSSNFFHHDDSFSATSTTSCSSGQSEFKTDYSLWFTPRLAANWVTKRFIWKHELFFCLFIVYLETSFLASIKQTDLGTDRCPHFVSFASFLLGLSLSPPSCLTHLTLSPHSLPANKGG